MRAQYEYTFFWLLQQIEIDLLPFMQHSFNILQSIVINRGFCLLFAGTGNSPAQSSTRSISPNSTSPGQFIHQQLQKSATTASIAGSLTTIPSPQQAVSIHEMILSIRKHCILGRLFNLQWKWNVVDFHFLQVDKKYCAQNLFIIRPFRTSIVSHRFICSPMFECLDWRKRRRCQKKYCTSMVNKRISNRMGMFSFVDLKLQ